MSARAVTRREFLFGLGAFPFFWRRRGVRLAGARFRVVRKGRSPHRYLWIHGNEDTARQVLEGHIRAHPGVAYLIQNTRRNVAIQGGQLDPNRMFSREGAARNLRTLNPRWNPAQVDRALGELDRGRARLVRALFPAPGGRIVVLHNNSEGYSVRDELEASDRTSLGEPGNPHAFFLCTSAEDFAALAASPYNVVLQQGGKGVDDGSLSRLAARRGVRYVNLEVALGDAERQRAMMEWLEAHLP